MITFYYNEISEEKPIRVHVCTIKKQKQKQVFKTIFQQINSCRAWFFSTDGLGGTEKNVPIS